MYVVPSQGTNDSPVAVMPKMIFQKVLIGNLGDYCGVINVETHQFNRKPYLFTYREVNYV